MVRMPDHMRSYLDFEKPVAELDSKVDELRALAAGGSDIGEEISSIELLLPVPIFIQNWESTQQVHASTMAKTLARWSKTYG